MRVLPTNGGASHKTVLMIELDLDEVAALANALRHECEAVERMAGDPEMIGVQEQARYLRTCHGKLFAAWRRAVR
ncbi:MAG: hypothetical protein K8H74_17950 [Notoacmeibacter sp.]|nr:hypothetical protein [Notoacmeibacter sp.]